MRRPPRVSDACVAEQRNIKEPSPQIASPVTTSAKFGIFRGSTCSRLGCFRLDRETGRRFAHGSVILLEVLETRELGFQCLQLRLHCCVLLLQALHL